MIDEDVGVIVAVNFTRTSAKLFVGSVGVENVGGIRVTFRTNKNIVKIREK